MSVLLNRRVEQDPVTWSRRVLDFYPWNKQVELAEAINNHDYICCRSANGTGKSAWIAALALHFALRHRRNRRAHCAIVSQNSKRLKGSTVKWLRIHHAAGKLPGTVRNDYYELDDDKEKIGWYTPVAGEQSSNSLQGVHAEILWILIDEANECTRSLWEQCISLDTTDDVKIIAVGNPTSTGTPFHECFSKPNWHPIHISAFHTPIISGDVIEHPSWRRGFMSKKKLEQKRIEYTTPAFKARCEGEFPEMSEQSLIEPSWIIRAQDHAADRLKEFFKKNNAERILGVDPGSGGDPTIAKLRVGYVVQDVDLGKDDNGNDWASSPEREDVGERIADVAIELNVDRIVFDTFGVGVDAALACVERLRELQSSIAVISLNTGDTKKVIDEMFLNPKAELGWELRRLLENDLLLIPQSKELEWQLKEFRQKPHASGKLATELKRDMIKRLGRSPDDLDALLCTLYGQTASVDAEVFDQLNAA